jgi:small redox-active disulfide protein 2
MTKIEVVGTGCAKCKRLLANAEQAVRDLKITAEVIKVDDIDEIVNRGIMMTPALFINGKVRAIVIPNLVEGTTHSHWVLDYRLQEIWPAAILIDDPRMLT